jgi:peptide/nickel transport system substrate-binding protein
MSLIQRNISIPNKSNLANKRSLRNILDSFSSKQLFIFISLFVVLLVSALSILQKINKNFLVYLPEDGGTLTEGILGTPRFINPILAISDTDKDLSALIYSGLMKKNTDGTLVPNLAESYEVSPDGLTYSFKLKKDIKFQDKTSLTVDDVIFTVNSIKDPTIKSPLDAIWQGVSVSADENDSSVVIFKLSAPYASFLESTTLGIIPKHIWNQLQPEEFNLSKSNLNAIGSGPYKIKTIKQNKEGLVEEIKLTKWSTYSLEQPFIKKLNFIFYKSEVDLIKAYRKGNVDQISSISPKNADALTKEGYQPTTAVLSRVFGLFFNPNHNDIFRDKNVVKAIDLSIDKEQVVNDVLFGFGKAIDSPIPTSLSNEDYPILNNQDDNIKKAKDILESDGWKLNENTGIREKSGKPLQFSISTADVAELRNATEIMKANLAKVGIDVSIQVFETGMLNQTIIRPRDYEALFFGQIIRNDPDLFAFWHSSQRNDPGLNISLYTNTKVDKLLEELISSTDPNVRLSKLKAIQDQITSDMPAVFVYSPEFIYMEGDKINDVKLNHITSASERFLGINNWYIRTDAVWKAFVKN